MEECENMIHGYINKNETYTNRDNSDEVIEELPDITSPAMVENCLNAELNNSNKNTLNEVKKLV